MTISSSYIKQFTEIDALQSINGESLETLSKRLQDRGYLKKGYDLKSSITADWQTVQGMGLTPQKLADWAQDFLNQLSPTLIQPVRLYTIPHGSITYHYTREEEHDPFRKNSLQESELKIPSTWTDRAKITYGNISFILSSGRIAMIRELGFFGNTAEKRISPTTLFALVKPNEPRET